MARASTSTSWRIAIFERLNAMIVDKPFDAVLKVKLEVFGVRNSLGAASEAIVHGD